MGVEVAISSYTTMVFHLPWGVKEILYIYTARKASAAATGAPCILCISDLITENPPTRTLARLGVSRF